MNHPHFTREEINILSTFAKTAIATQQLSEDALKAMLEALRRNLLGTEKPANALTVKESCQRLKISKPTLYQLIKKGRINPIKLQKCTRILESEIDRILRGE